MKNKAPYLLLMLIPLVLFSAEIDIPLIVKNDIGQQKILHFGLDSMATDTIDTLLGESELPPFPPSDVFEARFIGDDIFLPQLGLGTYKDYRPGDSSFVGVSTHELAYQLGPGTSLTIIWDFPDFVAGMLQDFFEGIVLVDTLMIGADSLSVPNPGVLNKLRMAVFFSKEVPIELTRFDALAVDSGVLLSWQTVSESNNLGFEIQRSEDAVSYTKAAFIPGAGTSQTVHNYSYLDSIKKNGCFYYRLKQVDSDGSHSFSETVRVVLSAPTFFELEQNFPNPFNASTTIRFSIPRAGRVRLTIYNAQGKYVATLLDRWTAAGSHTFTFDASGFPSGVYLYQVQIDEFTHVKKMLLLR